MNYRLYLFSIMAVTMFVFSAEGAIIPSFYPNESSTRATHIVVATEGKTIDGNLKVIESWKGDLKKGEIINIPELKQFSSDESRTIKIWNRAKSERVTCSRMILFLIKSLSLTAGSVTNAKWIPAGGPEYRPVFAGGIESRNEADRIKISVAWVENDKVYAFRQVMNPGPLILTNNIGYESEKELKTLVLNCISKMDEYEKVMGLPDPNERAGNLVVFTEVDDHRKCEGAFNSLAECGAPAVPHLREMLRNDQLSDRHYLAVKALAKAGIIGSVEVGQELTDLLKDEMDYWKGQLSQVKGVRWNDLPVDIRERCLTTEQIIKALDYMCYRDAYDIVMEVRKLSISQPITHWCNEFLKHYD